MRSRESALGPSLPFSRCSKFVRNREVNRRSLEVIPGSPPDLREPPPGCRFAPRCFAAMAICSEEVPPEVSFDGVRVACHLWPAGSDGVTPAWTAATRPELVLGADAQAPDLDVA